MNAEPESPVLVGHELRRQDASDGEVMGTIGFGALLLVLGVFLLLDGGSENRFGRSVGRSAEGERIGGKLIAISGMVMMALGVIVMIAGLIAMLV